MKLNLESHSHMHTHTHTHARAHMCTHRQTHKMHAPPYCTLVTYSTAIVHVCMYIYSMTFHINNVTHTQISSDSLTYIYIQMSTQHMLHLLLIQMSTIPSYHERLRAMLFKIYFQGNIAEIKPVSDHLPWQPVLPFYRVTGQHTTYLGSHPLHRCTCCVYRWSVCVCVYMMYVYLLCTV